MCPGVCVWQQSPDWHALVIDTLSQVPAFRGKVSACCYASARRGACATSSVMMLARPGHAQQMGRHVSRVQGSALRKQATCLLSQVHILTAKRVSTIWIAFLCLDTSQARCLPALHTLKKIFLRKNPSTLSKASFATYNILKQAAIFAKHGQKIPV